MYHSLQVNLVESNLPGSAEIEKCLIDLRPHLLLQARAGHS
jgi:hypothetical protein